MPKIRTRQTLNSLWLRQRELGIKFPLGHQDRFHKTLYSSIKPVTNWDRGDPDSTAVHGGVFNLEFSPDGSLLLAACEKKSILMFDPLCRKLVHSIGNAHNDCINCVRFLDQRMFATCSDDSTVALWDARNLKQRIRTLQGHSNWVKNIEYSPADGLLLTSGFDGSIYTWDINSFTENSFLYTRVFHTNGLMRTSLSPDASKMLICTTSGYLIVIHNLRLSTLPEDLQGFKPNMYRLMQLSQTTIPVVANYTKLFSQSRTHNRVEFLTDFPPGDDAEVISSLQVHPQGWCALSRNVSNGEKSEWTCVHDIQERDYSELEQQKEDEGNATPYEVPLDEFPEAAPIAPSSTPVSSSSGSSSRSRSLLGSAITESIYYEQVTARYRNHEEALMARMFGQNRHQIPRRPRYYRNVLQVSAQMDFGEEDARDSNNEQRPTSASLEQQNPPENPPRLDLRRRLGPPFPSHSVELHVSSSDVWEALVAIREARTSRERDRVEFRNTMLENQPQDSASQTNEGVVSVNMPRSSHTVVIMGDRIRAPNRGHQPCPKMYAIPRNHKIHQNVPRLTHYIEEPNVGSGYIKELCFSTDGRLIFSPFGHGVRLLAFSNECQELSDCVPLNNTCQQLHELASNFSHKDIVVSTKFSPKHCLLVSGCLAGRIVWHQPVV